MPRFQVESTGSEHEWLADAAQEAECLHAETEQTQTVLATVDCDQGHFRRGDVVYTSKGAPE